MANEQKQGTESVNSIIKHTQKGRKQTSSRSRRRHSGRSQGSIKRGETSRCRATTARGNIIRNFCWEIKEAAVCTVEKGCLGLYLGSSLLLVWPWEDCSASQLCFLRGSNNSFYFRELTGRSGEVPLLGYRDHCSAQAPHTRMLPFFSIAGKCRAMDMGHNTFIFEQLLAINR